jgi:transcriptional antiterminator RfaH
MPILAPETSLYPENLLDEAESLGPDHRWWAVYTKSRQEKSLARQLLSQEVPFYLPLATNARMVAGRRVESQLPLFGSYLFLYATHEQRLQTLETKRVAHLFEVADSASIAHDLRNVRTLIASGVPLTVEGRLAAGQRVRVKHGSLMGIEGVVVERRGEDRLLVAVDFLQQGVSILIRDFQVEPV